MEDAPDGRSGVSRNARFSVRSVLGKGAMGVVYCALDLETGREVALKTFHTLSPEEIYYLKREFRALADLSHPNLVQLHDLFASEDQCFFSMELIRGTDLLSLARDGGRPPAARYAALRSSLAELALGLETLHQLGKLHRDIKPSNVLVEPGGRTVLLDFGLVTSTRHAGGAVRGEPDAFAGTPAYMAPEQLRGEAPSPASDWFSVGVLLYECLTGELPDLEKGGRIAAPRETEPGSPEDLDGLALELLRSEPGARPTGAEILRRLGPIRQRGPVVRAGRTDDGGFVGRHRELQRLEEALRRSREGACVVLRIEGVSGIGKSMLLERFTERVAGAGEALVLRGRCHPQESLRFKALDGVVDELSRFLVGQPPGQLESLAPTHLAALVRIFPVLARVPFKKPSSTDPLPGVEPQEIRRRAFGALRELLEGLAAWTPLVVWIDDLQWGDLDSAPLLRALLRLPGPPRLLLLLSSRSEDRHESPLLDDLEGHEGDAPLAADATLEIQPLTTGESRELIRRLLGSAAGANEEREEAIAAECEGSPFFIEQLVGSLRDAPAEDGDACRRRPDLAQVVSERVSALTEEARRLVEVSSVAGEPLSRSLLLQAAGFGEDKRAVVLSLHHHALLRPTTLGDEAAVRPYHDRIRESVLASLPGTRLVAHHRALAEVLEASGRATPDALARHYRGAGELLRAADHAVAAGDRAANALAFLRAAEFYGQALDWGAPEPERRRDLTVKRAAALGDAGHGGEAAPLFLAAADGSPTNEADSLRRRAAEQFMVSGRIVEGLAVLRPMLAELGVSYPQSTGRATAGLVLRLLQLGLRRTRYTTREAARVPVPELARIDACHATVKGLVMVNPITGAYFAVRSLLLALQAGEPVRIGRSLCVVGASMVPAGALVEGWARRMIHSAEELAEEQEDPYLRGMASIAAAQLSMMQANWSEMLARCDTGLRLLQDHCQGVAWERHIGSMGGMRALEEMGQVPRLLARARALLEEAEDTGDLYAQVTARLNRAFWRIAEGDTAGAREEARATIELWASEAFHVQHFYALRIEACCDLYEGRPDAGWERISGAWPAIRESGLLRHALLRTDIYALRARVACALARVRTRDRKRLLHSAEGDARRLARTGRPDAVATARLIEAAVLAARGESRSAGERLEAAILGFESRQMALHAAAARQRRSECEAAGAPAEAAIREQGIRDPSRWLPLLAPAVDPSRGQETSDLRGSTPK